MKLYFSPGACSLSPHIALLEAGLPCHTEQVDLGTKMTASGIDYRTINPKGYVPALELDDGSLLTEAAVVVQYIADQAPDKQLAAPAGTLARYRQMAWLNFIATELHKNFGPLFNPAASGELKNTARANLAKRLPEVARVLESQEFLAGERFSVADCYLFTVLSWSGHVQVALDAWPQLGAYLARIAARPAVQQALRDEGLLG
ncbi:MAG: glutathione transferase GstA [Massilia sp.]